MQCTNQIQEHRVSRECWFPIDPTSPFELCKRCSYQKVEELLHETPFNTSWLSKPTALALFKEKDHTQSIVRALLKIDQNELNSAWNAVKTDYLVNHLNHIVYFHTPSENCQFYKWFLKHRNLERTIHQVDLPWNCWNCMSFVFRQKSMLDSYRAFTNGLLKYKLENMERNTKHIVDLMISMEFQGKDHIIRSLLTYIRLNVNDDLSRTVLVKFLGSPPMASSIFTARYRNYMPFSWEKEELKKKVLQEIKLHTYGFKEELIQKTWAPERLFNWCFDLEDLGDFA